MLGLRIWFKTTLYFTNVMGGFDLSWKLRRVEFNESVLRRTEEVLESGRLLLVFFPFFFLAGFTLGFGISSIPK